MNWRLKQVKHYFSVMPLNNIIDLALLIKAKARTGIKHTYLAKQVDMKENQRGHLNKTGNGIVQLAYTVHVFKGGIGLLEENILCNRTRSLSSSTLSLQPPSSLSTSSSSSQ